MSAHCAGCGAAIDEERDPGPDNRRPCSSCGSTARRFDVAITAAVKTHVRLIAKFRRSGLEKPAVELLSGDDLHRKSGKWMQKDRVIDHEADQYSERVVDPATGEIVHEQAERLSEHRGHGDDHRRG